MKKLLLVICLSFAPVFFWGCRTVPSERVVQVQSLKAVGHTAESAIAVSAQLYNSRRITAAQARDIIDFYDNHFQPAYRIAVRAVNANLDSIANPELVDLAAQLAALVANYQKP